MTQKQKLIATFGQAHSKEYHCFCSKTYNSYAGLYLHLKTKHQPTFQKYKNMKISKLLKSSFKENGTQIFKLKDQEYQQKKSKKTKTQHYESEIKNKTLEPIIKKNVENNYRQQNYNNSANLYNSFPFNPSQKIQNQSPFPIHYGQYGQPWCHSSIGYPSFPQPNFQNYFQPPANMLQNFPFLPNFSQSLKYRGTYPNNYSEIFNGWPLNEPKWQLPYRDSNNLNGNNLQIQKNGFKFFQNQFNLCMQDAQKQKIMFATKQTLCQTPNCQMQKVLQFQNPKGLVIQNKEKSSTNEANPKKQEIKQNIDQYSQQNQ